uniref:polysaccharide biosynthesis protein n=1 Tax=Corynebacterium sp. TaxID=1720 RepID=UPI0037356A24
EMYPQEAWLTNVEGTQNVLDASVACGADVVVNVSTDKAANPVCALGDSKRIAERLTAAYGAEYPGTWVSVRFGNVLGSRGSVIETFRRQIETGGPVTVTHPEVRRYFMTIPEAAQLVLQAAVGGASGETMVLDLGHPMPIIDLARGLMKIAGRDDLEIVYTGLRPGEKMSEELLDDREDPVRADRHPMITEVRVEPLHPLPDCPHNVTPTLRALARNAHSEEPSLL